jgi:hypothetical protein
MPKAVINGVGLFYEEAGQIPSAGLLVIPRAGHTINLEEPDVFNRAVLDFISEVESGRWRPPNPQSLTGSAILPADTGGGR